MNIFMDKLGKKIKLVASDLDGTILLDGAQKIPEDMFDVLERLMDKGIYFVAASGRQYLNVADLFSPIKDRLIYLCENGSLVVNSKGIILKRVFKDELAFKICREILKVPDIEILISGQDVSYILPRNKKFPDYMRKVVGTRVKVVDKLEDIDENILKISYFIDESRRDEVTEVFRKKFGSLCDVMTSGGRWVDFMPFGINKGSALRYIAESLNIKPEEILVFGDNENDRQMLQYAGHAYLVQKCDPSMEKFPAERCSSVQEVLESIIKSEV